MKAGWPFVPLGLHCSLENGDRGKNYPGRKAFVDAGVPFVNAGHLSDGVLNLAEMNYISREHFARLGSGKIRKGDLLFCLRGSLGKYAIVDNLEEGAIASSLVIVRPNRLLDPLYLSYYFGSPLCDAEITKHANGAAQPNLSAKSLAAFNIPLPPLEEQHRIVALLDEAFEGLSRARANAEANLADANELLELQLASYFEQGQANWQSQKLGEITTKIGSGATPIGGANAYLSEGIPLIRSLNVHDRRFKVKDLAFIDDVQAQKLKNVVVEEADVLLNITGASITRCCLAPPEFIPARVNQHVAIVRPRRSTLLPEFLAYLLTSRPYKDRLLNRLLKKSALDPV